MQKINEAYNLPLFQTVLANAGAGLALLGIAEMVFKVGEYNSASAYIVGWGVVVVYAAIRLGKLK